MAIWDAVGSSLLGALVGGAVTGYFTIRVAKQSADGQLRLQNDNRANLVKGFLQAVHDEMETLWDLYQTGIGVQLEALQEGWALLMYYPVVFDYFTVYNTNAHLLGHVKDPDLRRLIVQVYSKGRGLLDGYRLNNDLVGKVEHWQMMFNSEPENKLYRQNFDAHLKSAQVYAGKIRRQHNELKELVSALLRQLRQMGATARPAQ